MGNRGSPLHLSRSLKLASAAEIKRSASVGCHFYHLDTLAYRKQCRPDPESPSHPCLPCQKYNRTSGKTIHKIECQRSNVSDFFFSRLSKLALAKAFKKALNALWDKTHLKNTRPEITRIIEIMCAASDEPFTATVVPEVGPSGDANSRIWYDETKPGEEKKKSIGLTVWSVFDVDIATTQMKIRLEDGAVISMEVYTDRLSVPYAMVPGDSDDRNHDWYWNIDRTFHIVVDILVESEARDLSNLL